VSFFYIYNLVILKHQYLTTYFFFCQTITFAKDEYWSLLRDGIDAITEVPQSRWDLKRYHRNEAGQISSKYGGLLEQYGILDNLDLAPISRRSVGSDEVEIEVHATGLNFRDVLNALGMLKAYYASGH
jgi:hypothetical protein